MQKGWLWLELVLVSVVVSTQNFNIRNRNELDLIIDDQSFLSAQNSVNKRLFLKLDFNFTEEEILALFDSVETIFSSWKSLKILEDEILKKELGKQLDLGIALFRKCKTFFDYLYSQLKRVLATPRHSTCVYTSELLDKDVYTAQMKYLMLAWAKVSASWDVDQVKADVGKMSIIYDVIHRFNQLAENWAENLYHILNIWEELNENKFPEHLNGLLNLLPCLQSSQPEAYKIINCDSDTTSLFCDIDAIYPETTKQYIVQKPINYENIELMFHPKIFLVKNEDGEFKFLNCSFTDPKLGVQSALPICYETEYNENCLSALARKDNSKSIEHCEFHFADPELGHQLKDNGILVEGTEVIAQIGENLVPIKPPIVIYTSEKVILTSKNPPRKITFPGLIPVVEQYILTSRLSTSQIALMQKRVY